MESCIRGFHVYHTVWTPYIGEDLDCVRESGNSEDPFAVAVTKAGETIGHVPRTISCVCSLFLRQRGTISCTVTGNRRRSSDLPQGGLEVPCLLTFTGPEELLQKVRKRLEEIGRRALCGSSTANVAESSSTETCTSTEADIAGKVDVIEGKIGQGESCTGNEAGVAEEGIGQKEMCTHDEPDVTKEKIIQRELCSSVQPMTCGEGLDQECQLMPMALQQKPTVATWLKFEDIVLTTNDKQLIENGMCLTDQHISFAQRLLRHQFPKMNGLRLTLLQDRPHSQPTVNALQVLHIKKSHWIVAFTKLKGKLVYVYDSSFSSIDQATAKTIQTNFRCSMLSIRLVKCQKQVGAEDCGLFAIAFATSLAFGEDPSTRQYCQAKMRAHLLECFLNKQLELFP